MSKKGVADHELGQLLYKSQLNWIVQGTKLIFLGGFSATLYALSESFANPENSLNDSLTDQLIGFALGAVLAFFIIAILVHLCLTLFMSLTVYEYGIHSRRLSHSIKRQWDEFEVIKLSRLDFELLPHANFLTFKFFEYKIKDWDGNRLVITNDYRAVDILLELVVKPIHQHLVQYHLAKLQNGETLHFGKVSLSKQFIATGNKQKLWAEIDRCNVDNNSIFPSIAFFFEGRCVLWFPLNIVPNDMVLLSLLDELEIEKLVLNEHPFLRDKSL